MAPPNYLSLKKTGVVLSKGSTLLPSDWLRFVRCFQSDHPYGMRTSPVNGEIQRKTPEKRNPRDTIQGKSFQNYHRFALFKIPPDTDTLPKTNSLHLENRPQLEKGILLETTICGGYLCLFIREGNFHNPWFFNNMGFGERYGRFDPGPGEGIEPSIQCNLYANNTDTYLISH